MKKRTKKLISMSLASIMALSLAGCGGSSGGSDSSKKEGSGDAGKTLNIWCWNDEFQSRFNDYYPEVEKVSKDKSTTTLKDGTVVKWTINPNENNNYQNKLDEALLNQEKASADDKIDIFLIEADYALKYVDSDYTMDIKDLGLTDDDLSEQYQYTKDIVTVDGTQKGTTWQATPGLFAYRRSIAKDVLGTDDPDEISAMVSDWDSFIETGKKIKESSGGAVNMIPGIDTLVQPLVNQTGLRWRDENKLMVQENFTDTIELMLKLKEAEIDAGLDVWTPAWNASFGQGNVFCYPGSCWFQSYVIEPNDPEGSGNWGVAEVPGGAYNWGGIWWGMYNQSENKDAVAAWMKYELSKEGAQNKYDLIHFYPGVKSAYEDDYLNKPNEFFGGENVTELYLKEMDEMTVLRPIADDALFYNSMTFFAQSLEGTADEIAEKVEEDIISSNPQYEK